MNPVLRQILKFWPQMVMVVLALLMFLFWQASRKVKEVMKPYAVTQTVRDTVLQRISIPRPYPVYRDTGSLRDTLYLTDTVQIIREYLTKNVYRRVLKDDSTAYIEVCDTTFRNELLGGRLSYRNRTVTRIIQQNAFLKGLYLGGMVSTEGYGISASWVNNRWQTNVIYNVQNKGVQLGIGYRIFKKQ